MRGIFNPECERLFEEKFAYYNGIQNITHRASWDFPKELFDIASKHTAKSLSESEKHLSFLISLSNIAYCCLNALAMNFLVFEKNLQANDGHHIFPENWLSDDLVPNPNLILQQLLTQISNLIYSVIHLVEIGHDNPARILLRSLDEMCQVCMIAMYSKEDFISYSKSKEVDDSQMMFDLFSKSRRIKKLRSLEKSLGISETESSYFSQKRADAFRMFSGHVHGAPLPVMFGSYVWGFASGMATPGLWGGVSKTSTHTLSALIDSMNYFFKLIENVYKFRTPATIDFIWYGPRTLSMCLNDVLINLAEKQDAQYLERFKLNPVTLT